MLKNRISLILLLIGIPLWSQEEIGKTFQIGFKDILSDKYISSDQYIDSLLVVHFWASQCSPCNDVVPEVTSFFEKYTKQDIHLIGISKDRNNETAKAYCSDNNITWPQILENMVFDKHNWSVRSTPRFFLVQNGVIIDESPALFAIEDKIKKILEKSK